LATAPNGVQKLRDLILELAIMGKLVPRDFSDEPATILLERIAQKRVQAESAAPRRKNKQKLLAADESWPFAAPDGWEWSRLSDLTQVLNGRAYSKDELLDSGTPVLRVGNLFTSNHWYYSNLTLEPEKYCDEGDLIYSWSASFGPFIWSGPKVIYHYHIWKLALFDETNYSKAFLYKYLLAKTAEIKAAGHGVSMVHMTKEKMEKLPVPVPPLAEQQRIVAKVDELMTLCDQLEAEQGDAVSAHAQLVETLLSSLTQSINAADFAASWERLAECFDTLFTTESSLDALKQTILQLAVTGKLVRQNLKDQPATELLMRIAQIRTRSRTQVAKAKVAAMPLMQGDRLPSGWEAATLPDLCVVGGGATPSKAKSVYWGEGLPWVSPKDMKVEHIFDAQDHVTELALKESRLPRVPSGSLLIVVRGMILIHSFPVATTQVDVAINQDMKSLTPFVPEIQSYLALALRGWKQQILSLVDRSTHGTCKLQSEKLFAFKIGIPPLAEQHRIVGKVNELMILCDRLRTDLADARRRQGRLASALTGSALKAA
jgi:type I restriction enzyme S subunit